MGRQYCFLGTFQQTIGFLDTRRGRTIAFLSEKGDTEVCSIVVTLIYRKYRAYRHFSKLSTPGINGPIFWSKLRERAPGGVYLRSKRLVSRLVATDFLDWTGFGGRSRLDRTSRMATEF
jgi:hypothetical protein